MKIYKVPSVLSGLVIPQEMSKGAAPLKSEAIAKATSGTPKILDAMPDIVRKALAELGINLEKPIEVHEFEAIA